MVLNMGLTHLGWRPPIVMYMKDVGVSLQLEEPV